MHNHTWKKDTYCLYTCIPTHENKARTHKTFYTYVCIYTYTPYVKKKPFYMRVPSFITFLYVFPALLLFKYMSPALLLFKYVFPALLLEVLRLAK